MKTELQKMLDGELYNAMDEELVTLRNKAKRMTAKLNALDYDSEERKPILKSLLGSTKTNFDILSPFFCDYGCHITLGENCFMNFNCIILDCAKVTIGDNVMMGPNVQLYTASHPVLASERIKGPELAAPITIGNNVWLGGGVIVCPGVTIGDNTTIGAGSVVTKDIPSNVVAAGNPCRVIRTLPEPSN